MGRLAMMTLPNTRQTPACLGYWGQCTLSHRDKKCRQIQQTGAKSVSTPHPQLHYALDAIHNDYLKWRQKKTLYTYVLRCKRNLTWNGFYKEQILTLNTKALLQTRWQTGQWGVRRQRKYLQRLYNINSLHKQTTAPLLSSLTGWDFTAQRLEWHSAIGHSVFRWSAGDNDDTEHADAFLCTMKRGLSGDWLRVPFYLLQVLYICIY